MKIVKVILLIFAIGIFSECTAIHLKDSNKAMYLRIGYKEFNYINLTQYPNNNYYTEWWNNKVCFGFYAGLRHSSILDKNKRWVSIKSLLVHYDYSQETFVQSYLSSDPTYPNHAEFNYINLSLVSSEFSYGIKYNSRWVRPALSLFANSSMFSRAVGVHSVGEKAGIFRPNNKSLKHKLNPGIKFELHFPISQTIGLIATGSGSFPFNFAGKRNRFVFAENYLGFALDYKISK